MDRIKFELSPMTIRISELGVPLADIDLVDSKLKVKVHGSNDWVLDLIYGDLRRRVLPGQGIVTLTDQELFDSLKERLAGQISAGDLLEEPLPNEVPSVAGIHSGSGNTKS